MKVGGEDKRKKYFETGKLIYAKLLWNMAVWLSSYVTILLRYGGLRMDLHLKSVLERLLSALVFSRVYFSLLAKHDFDLIKE
jgi:hypothetical protein